MPTAAQRFDLAEQQERRTIARRLKTGDGQILRALLLSPNRVAQKRIARYKRRVLIPLMIQRRLTPERFVEMVDQLLASENPIAQVHGMKILERLLEPELRMLVGDNSEGSDNVIQAFWKRVVSAGPDAADKLAALEVAVLEIRATGPTSPVDSGGGGRLHPLLAEPSAAEAPQPDDLAGEPGTSDTDRHPQE